MTRQPRRILLLSAYHAASHRYWCEGIQRYFADDHWTCLTLPPRYFNWRIRGNPLSWLSENQPELSAAYDLVVATSTVDVASLKGLLPSLSRVPWLVYFHENQFEYPRSAAQHPSVDAQMVNLYALLAADRALFNSAFNRDTLLSGIERLLKRLPDHRPRSLKSLVAEKIAVLPVPIDDQLGQVSRRPSAVFTLCWNHRWEYDKGPDRLLLTLRELRSRQIPFRLHLLGEGFRRQPPSLLQLQQEFADQLGQVGYLPSRDDYYRCLAESHLVISNSLHEFQGLAVLEAVALGALPRVPARLSYPELFPDHCCYRGDSDPQVEAAALADTIAADYQQWLAGCLPAAPDLSRLFWSELGPAYAAELDALAPAVIA